MALLASVNYLGVKALADTNSAITWWKVASRWPRSWCVALANGGMHSPTSTPPTGSTPTASRASCSRSRPSGIIFSYLGFEQADQLAGEAKNPKRDIPIAVIGSIVLGLIIYILLQLVFLLALPASAIGEWCDGTRRRRRVLPAQLANGAANPRSTAVLDVLGPASSRRWSASAGWRRSSTSTR